MSKVSKTNHDQLFKELLSTFFQQFLEEFFPQIAQELDFTHFSENNFLQQEYFPDLKASKLHRIDILAKVQLKGKKDEDYVIVIVEAQRSKRREFLARIFRYFALIHIKTGKMVLPVVIYTDDAKWELTEDWHSYKLNFAGKQILNFNFFALKLKNLKVKDYLKSHNPATLALASTMDLEDNDLVEIKLTLLRGLTNSVKNAAEMMKTFQFIDQYLWENDLALQNELDKIYNTKNQINTNEDDQMGRLMEAIEARGEARGIAKGEARGEERGERQAYLKSAEEMMALGLGEDLTLKITGINFAQLKEWIDGGRK
jgi:predicted transposase/invertase (TIGR01784 family)